EYEVFGALRPQRLQVGDRRKTAFRSAVAVKAALNLGEMRGSSVVQLEQRFVATADDQDRGFAGNLLSHIRPVPSNRLKIAETMACVGPLCLTEVLLCRYIIQGRLQLLVDPLLIEIQFGQIIGLPFKSLTRGP